MATQQLFNNKPIFVVKTTTTFYEGAIKNRIKTNFLVFYHVKFKVFNKTINIEGFSIIIKTPFCSNINITFVDTWKVYLEVVK